MIECFIGYCVFSNKMFYKTLTGVNKVFFIYMSSKMGMNVCSLDILKGNSPKILIGGNHFNTFEY
jgi:hypothetical protein